MRRRWCPINRLTADLVGEVVVVMGSGEPKATYKKAKKRVRKGGQDSRSYSVTPKQKLAEEAMRRRNCGETLSVSDDGPKPPAVGIEEKTYSPKELAVMWGYSVGTIRKLI